MLSAFGGYLATFFSQISDERGTLTRMKYLGWVLCCFFFCAPVLYAIDNSPSQDLANDLKGKIVFLRGMESGDKLSFDPQGALIGTDTPGSFANSAVKIEGVDQSDTELKIKGKRVALIFESASESPSLQDIRFVPLKESIDVVIAVSPQHPEVLDGALKKVFAFRAEEILSKMSPDPLGRFFSQFGARDLTDHRQ